MNTAECELSAKINAKRKLLAQLDEALELAEEIRRQVDIITEILLAAHSK